MENLPPADSQAEGLEKAIAEFTAALAQVEATRLADATSEQFLRQFSRELSAERQMELLLRALVLCLRGYAEQGHVDPKLELLLRDWWGNTAFQELGQALKLFARAAESRGVGNERRKIRTALPRLMEQQLPQGDRHDVRVHRRSGLLTKRLASWARISFLLLGCVLFGIALRSNFGLSDGVCESGLGIKLGLAISKEL